MSSLSITSISLLALLIAGGGGDDEEATPKQKVPVPIIKTPQAPVVEATKIFDEEAPVVDEIIALSPMPEDRETISEEIADEQIAIIASPQSTAPTLQATTQSNAPTCHIFSATVNKAIERAPMIQAAQATVEQRLAERDASTSRRLPQLSFQSRAGVGDGVQADNQFDNRAGLNLSQLIFDFGVTRLQSQAAGFRAEAAEFNVLESQTEVGVQTAQIYLALLRARERLEAIIEIEDYYRQDSEAVERRLKRQLIKQSEASGILAEYALAKARRAREELNIAQAEAQLSSLLQEDFTCAVPTSLTPFIEANLPTDIASAERLAFDQSGRIKAAKAEILAAEAETKQAARGILPSVSLSGSYTYDYREETDTLGRPTGENDWQQFDRIGIDVSSPLYQGGRGKAVKRNAAASLRGAQARLAEQRRQLSEHIVTSWTQAQFLNTVSLRQSEARTSFKNLADAVQREYDRGIATVPELIDAKRDYFSAALTEIDTRYELYLQQMALIADTGKLQRPELLIKN